MAALFVDQGYDKTLVHTGMKRALSLDRSSTLQPKKKSSKSSRPILAITFHPHNIHVKNIIMKNFHIIQDDPTLLEIFPEKPMVAYRRDTNIRDHLVHAKLKDTSTYISPGTHPCGDPKCKICEYVNQTTDILGHKGRFRIGRRFTCQSSNIIYAVICLKFSEQSRTMMLYVGETYRTLAVRGEEHLRAATLGYKTQVGEHFQQPGHCPDTHLFICGL